MLKSETSGTFESLSVTTEWSHIVLTPVMGSSLTGQSRFRDHTCFGNNRGLKQGRIQDFPLWGLRERERKPLMWVPFGKKCMKKRKN